MTEAQSRLAKTAAALPLVAFSTYGWWTVHPLCAAIYASLTFGLFAHWILGAITND